MKKNKHLSRAWFWSYVCFVFGGTLLGLLLMKNTMPLAIVMICLDVVALGLIIAGRVLYGKNRKLFPYFAFSGQGLLSLLTLAAIVVEIAYTAQGKPAVYAWVFGIITLGLMVYIDIVTVHYCIKIIRGETIVEGKQ